RSSSQPGRAEGFYRDTRECASLALIAGGGALLMVVVLEATYTVTDPPLKLLRRFIPPLRLGGVALDLSFFVLMIIVYILISVVRGVGSSM
ncbi:YggT family protein, partial [Streptomyces zhihengii]